MKMKQLIACMLTVAVCLWVSAAKASDDINRRSGRILKVIMQHPIKDFEDSALSGFYPRVSIAAGLGEKIINLFWDENGDTLGFMLTESAQPSGVTDNPYVNLTKGQNSNGRSYEDLLASKISSSHKQLAPYQVLDLALDVTDNDYWLATLTIHNLFKEVAYASRLKREAIVGWDSANPDNVNSGKQIRPDKVIDKLQQLRPIGDPHMKDKIGPWYHMFGLFFVGGMLSGNEAEVMAGMENLTRKLGLGSGRDLFKEDLNVLSANLTYALNEIAEIDINIPEDLTSFSFEELKGMKDKLRERSRTYQDELVLINALVLANPHSPGAEWGMDVVAEWRMDVISIIQGLLSDETSRVGTQMIITRNAEAKRVVQERLNKYPPE